MTDELLTQLQQLAPWHMDIELPNNRSTAEGNLETYDNADCVGVSVINTSEMTGMFAQLYPDGLAGKRFLDVGCNAGGYCFMANRLGADFAYGFDVRDHWINQAKFIAHQWNLPNHQVAFDTHHIESLKTDWSFDVTLFKGVFYHLPHPILAVKILAEVTTETIVLDTSCRTNIPEDCMAIHFESQTRPMSGVDRLAWYPGGPLVLQKILQWAGFPFAETVRWITDPKSERKRKKNLGRIRVVASRNQEVIEGLKSRRNAEAEEDAKS